MNKLIQVTPSANIVSIKPTLLDELDRLVNYIGQPCIITSGFRQGDSGQHGLGRAVDIMCPSLNVLDLYLTAERFNFVGIGVYSDWASDGVVYGGLHLDIRDGKPARWFGVRDQRSGDNQYLPLNKETLQKYGVI